jgi:hypothetical protein
VVVVVVVVVVVLVVVVVCESLGEHPYGWKTYPGRRIVLAFTVRVPVKCLRQIAKYLCASERPVAV